MRFFHETVSYRHSTEVDNYFCFFQADFTAIHTFPTKFIVPEKFHKTTVMAGYIGDTSVN